MISARGSHHMRSWLATALITLIALQFMPTQTSAQTADGVIRVVVRRTGTGEGVPYATVVLTGDHEGVHRQHRASTDAGGIAVFRNLAPVRYFAHAEAEGYLPMVWSIMGGRPPIYEPPLR